MNAPVQKYVCERCKTTITCVSIQKVCGYCTLSDTLKERK